MQNDKTSMTDFNIVSSMDAAHRAMVFQDLYGGRAKDNQHQIIIGGKSMDLIASGTGGTSQVAKEHNEGQAIRAFLGAADKHHATKFDLEAHKLRLSAEQLVRIDRVVTECLKRAAPAIGEHLANPLIDAEVLARTLANALQTFLMIGPKDAYAVAPEAFTLACENSTDILSVDDVTIALCAFLGMGKYGAVTRYPASARKWAESAAKDGKTPIRINKGAYIVCYTSEA